MDPRRLSSSFMPIQRDGIQLATEYMGSTLLSKYIADNIKVERPDLEKINRREGR